jgi:hypothetical protein
VADKSVRHKIAAIDRQVSAIRRQLHKLESIDPTSAESWQNAWDKHPDLRKREAALYRERGKLQLEADRA